MSKLHSMVAIVLALALSCGAALAQSGQGTSPLTGPKGGTNNAFMQFTGPATPIKTYTLPNASDTIATLAAIQSITGAKTFASAKLLLAGSLSGAGTLNAPAAASTYVWTLPTATDTLVGRATTDTLTGKTINGNDNTLTVLAGSQLSGSAPVSNGGTGQSSIAQHEIWVGDAANSVAKKSIPDCQDATGNHLNYTRSTQTFSCGTSSSGGGGGAGTAPYEHGRLTYVSATSIKFAPFKGNQLKLNGSMFSIPTSGIAGCGNTSVFVNGTSSNLAASTLYYVYAFSNSGTLTCDFSTTGRATSTTAGNEGTEIKSGDDTRSLIGLIRTNASSQFVDSVTQRFVRSWFNEASTSTKNAFTAARSTASATLVEINTEIRNEFLIWAGEKINAHGSGATSNSTSISFIFTGISLDGGTPATLIQTQSATGASQQFGASPADVFFGAAEGYHYITIFGAVGAGGGTAFWPIVSGALNVPYQLMQTTSGR